MLRRTHREMKRISVKRDRLRDAGATEDQGARPSSSKLTDAEEQQIVSAYTDGATVYEVGAQLHCDRRTVGQVLKRNGVTIRYQTPSDEVVDEMVRLYSTGLSLASIGRRAGYDPKTVLNHLRQRRVTTRDTHRREQ